MRFVKTKIKLSIEVRTFLLILFGIIIGIACSMSFLITYRAWGLHNLIQSPINLGKLDTTKESLIQSINQFKITTITFQEKFDSVNKRLDDFLLFGGLIITLLLALSISVYFKTEAEVDKHMKTRTQEIEKYIEKSKQVLNEGLTEIGSLLANARIKSDAIGEIQKNVSKILLNDYIYGCPCKSTNNFRRLN